MKIYPGGPYPLGATYDGAGTNFALFSEVAERVELCLFDEAGNETRVDLPAVTAFCRHGYLPYGWDLLIVAVIAIGFFAWGLACGWRTPEVEAIKMEAQANPGAILVPPDEETAERLTGR